MRLNETPRQTNRAPLSGDIKAQGVRLLDVGVFGPLMVYSMIDKQPPVWLRLAVVGIGLGTILYNLNNFLEIRKRLQNN